MGLYGERWAASEPHGWLPARLSGTDCTFSPNCCLPIGPGGRHPGVPGQPAETGPAHRARTTGPVHTTDVLESLGGEQTSGQLYHPLRALHSARLITQRRRGEYELAPQAMIQVLTILAAALDLANDSPLGPPDPPARNDQAGTVVPIRWTSAMTVLNRLHESSATHDGQRRTRRSPL